MKQKKGISPIISTVLLIMIVIVLAIIILLWSKGFIKETITKQLGNEPEKDIQSFCREIGMSRILNSDGSFGFTNSGNVPIYKVNLKLTYKETGSSVLEEILPEQGGLVNPGFASLMQKADGDYYNYNDYEEVKIIPVLLGKSTSSGGITEFPCPEENALII